MYSRHTYLPLLRRGARARALACPRAAKKRTRYDHYRNACTNDPWTGLKGGSSLVADVHGLAQLGVKGHEHLWGIVAPW